MNDPVFPPKLLVSHPVLAVADVVRAADFYASRLGFRYDRFWGEPPSFVMLFRGDVQIFLRSPASGPVEPAPKAYDECTGWDVYIRVSDADALHEEFVARGVVIARPPETAFYRMREFEVQDLDGHVLCFAHDVTAPPDSATDCPE
ncbi:MAG: VOC family protein [Isosphaeraceae bacterium]|nr:VOC family protein [Isosphaeraceae bacterium]